MYVILPPLSTLETTAQQMTKHDIGHAISGTPVYFVRLLPAVAPENESSVSSRHGPHRTASRIITAIIDTAPDHLARQIGESMGWRKVIGYWQSESRRETVTTIGWTRLYISPRPLRDFTALPLSGTAISLPGESVFTDSPPTK